MDGAYNWLLLSAPFAVPALRTEPESHWEAEEKFAWKLVFAQTGSEGTDIDGFASRLLLKYVSGSEDWSQNMLNDDWAWKAAETKARRKKENVRLLFFIIPNLQRSSADFAAFHSYSRRPEYFI